MKIVSIFKKGKETIEVYFDEEELTNNLPKEDFEINFIIDIDISNIFSDDKYEKSLTNLFAQLLKKHLFDNSNIQLTEEILKDECKVIAYESTDEELKEIILEKFQV